MEASRTWTLGLSTMLDEAEGIPMVAVSPEEIRDEAVGLFRQSELPEAFGWVEFLSPVHLRLFAVEVSDALKEAMLTGDLTRFIAIVEDWEATAEMDASPEVWAEITRPKVRRPLAHFINS